MASVTNFAAELVETAQTIASGNKGILAADESTGTIGKRFTAINVENNQDNRRAYRQLLFETEGLNQFISGAILFEETLFDTTAEGAPLVDLLKAQGIIPGIKVDQGVRELYGTDGETVTQGISGLAERCQRYYAAGARFAKWRAVLRISDSGCPSQLSIDQNAATLARYASICQANGLVPIVEPEVLMDGPHTIERAAEVTERVIVATYKACSDHHVLLEGSLLKPNMVRSGTECATPASMEEVARATVRVLQHSVPVAVPGVVFLSGGMSEEDATVALNEINKYPAKKPWTLSFSYGRALQQSVLKAWGGDAANKAAAQEQLLIRAGANSQAVAGTYGGDATSAAGNDSLHVANYSY